MNNHVMLDSWMVFYKKKTKKSMFVQFFQGISLYFIILLNIIFCHKEIPVRTVNIISLYFRFRVANSSATCRTATSFRHRYVHSWIFITTSTNISFILILFWTKGMLIFVFKMKFDNTWSNWSYEFLTKIL